MKIPALRAKIGDWEYYVTTLTFEQVNTWVSKVDDQLHKSEGLRDLIQRSITNNYLSIKDYIINQPEVFFNSLVLAVYDDYPDWREVELRYDEEETYQIGLLEFPGKHKIFPVDGQHRVEGIKEAIKSKPELKNNRISVIFIGHKNDDNGKERTRRLFTTLNRYAKPVALNEIIALDEDDIVAIATRYLIEEYDLFKDKKVIFTKQKAVPPSNKDAITSIITLYQANYELFLSHYTDLYDKKYSLKAAQDSMKFRPSNETIEKFKKITVQFWDAFKAEMTPVKQFMANDSVGKMRNAETGGNLIFRPIGFLPLVKASIFIRKSKPHHTFKAIFKKFNQFNLDLRVKPWRNVVWDPIGKSMLTGSDLLVELLLTYKYDKSLLKEKELKKLKEKYALKINYEGDDLDNVLDGV